MAKFLIRVDWLNQRIEFSPNLKIIKNELNNDRSVVSMELNYTPNLKEYPVYKYATNDIDVEEVFDDDPDSFWWKALMEVKPDANSAQVSASSPTLASAPTPAPVPSPAPTPAVTPAPISIPKPEPEPEVEIRPSPAEFAKLKAQYKQIQNIFQNLQNQAAEGKVSEKDFMEKQTFLGEKMGKIMSELDKWQESYE